MSSNEIKVFEAFLEDGIASFGNMRLDEQPSSHELWQEMLYDIEKQKPVSSMFLEDGRDTDGSCEMIDVCLEDAMKEECATQNMRHIAKTKNPKSKALRAR